MKDSLINLLPNDIRRNIFLLVSRNMRREYYKTTIPYKQIQDELTRDEFHKWIRIDLDEMDIFHFNVVLFSKIDYTGMFTYVDSYFYRATSTRFYNDDRTICVHARGTQKEYCRYCTGEYMSLSRKKRTVVCRKCGDFY